MKKKKIFVYGKFYSVKAKFSSLTKKQIREIIKNANDVLHGWKYIYVDEGGWLFASTHKRLYTETGTEHGQSFTNHIFKINTKEIILKSLDCGVFVSDFEIKRK